MASLRRRTSVAASTTVQGVRHLVDALGPTLNGARKITNALPTLAGCPDAADVAARTAIEVIASRVDLYAHADGVHHSGVPTAPIGAPVVNALVAALAAIEVVAAQVSAHAIAQSAIGSAGALTDSVDAPRCRRADIAATAAVARIISEINADSVTELRTLTAAVATDLRSSLVLGTGAFRGIATVDETVAVVIEPVTDILGGRALTILPRASSLLPASPPGGTIRRGLTGTSAHGGAARKPQAGRARAISVAHA